VNPYEQTNLDAEEMRRRPREIKAEARLGRPAKVVLPNGQAVAMDQAACRACGGSLGLLRWSRAANAIVWLRRAGWTQDARGIWHSTAGARALIAKGGTVTGRRARPELPSSCRGPPIEVPRHGGGERACLHRPRYDR
jgi:hypothetical protein